MGSRKIGRALAGGLVLAIAVLGFPGAARAGVDLTLDLVAIPGGAFLMGDAHGEPDEAPKTARVAPFRVMRHEVTNAQFAAFVSARAWVTDVEASGSGYVWTGRWGRVPGADWRHPTGPASAIDGKATHPVVQVSARDAAAFCAWAGLRLPSEAEWEFAARGRDGRRYPWGNESPQQGPGARANFGTLACCAPDDSDGYRGTAPVGRYPGGASPFGLLDMAGNVWEWTASRFPGKPNQVALRGGGWGNNPYCLRVSYRHGNPPDIGLDMVGFRCAGAAE
jgi:formylglycine-generating enzyme required for sulfatase activity